MEDDYKLLLKINLSYFDDGEKTEEPTQKKKKTAREEGQVAKSTEVGTAFLFIAVFLGLKSFAGFMYDRILAIFRHNFTLSSEIEDIFNLDFMKSYITYMFIQIIIISAPLLAASLIVGVASNIIQVGWAPTGKAIKPNFKRLNPISGMKKLFSMQAITELLKSVVKIFVIVLVLYNTAMDRKALLLAITNMELLESAGVLGQVIVDMGINVGVFYLFVALADFIYQRFKHNKELRMTKQEIKEEYKQAEGNPQIKGAIRQRMREASLRRMMSDVKKADVIITNPTHYAVAVKYDSGADQAPVVLAKGVDYMAKRIRENAKGNNVQIVENKPLARALYETCDIGKQIPPELYQAVAEILAFVYKLKNKI
ncbi:MAG: flagellar biosynthesis protein FlhB [Clostridiales bacterium]|jgi:flagellar biosynthetic protein FlhB|nr:flagellar biosynthesis protein FlhB [Clostridiales bacterium]